MLKLADSPTPAPHAPPSAPPTTATSTSTAATPPPGTLPKTGNADVALLVFIAAVLVLVGSATLALIRRNRHRHA